MEERLVDLEVRIAFLERHLEELDAVVRAIRDEVDRMRQDLRDLRSEGQAEATAWEKPPHY